MMQEHGSIRSPSRLVERGKAVWIAPRYHRALRLRAVRRGVTLRDALDEILAAAVPARELRGARI